jgi:trigger factor
MKLKTSVEKIEKNKVKMKVEVPNELFKEDVEKAYKKLSKSLKIPGFRKGKIPKKIIDTKVGEDYVFREALRESLLKYYYQSVLETKIRPIDQPEIKVGKIKKGKPLKFEAKVLVEPEVVLKKYKGIELKRRVARVGKKEIQSQIERLRNQFAKSEEDKSNIIKNGSIVLMDFDCYINDKLIKENSASDYLLQVGSGFLFGEREKELIGMKLEDEKQIEISYPEDFINKKVAGKKVIYNIKIKEIKKKILPEVNDEFAKMVGGFKNLDELKKYYREEIKKKKRENIESLNRVKILEELVKSNPIDIPEVMVENQGRRLMNNFKQNLERQGSSLEEFLRVTNQNENILEKRYKDRAELEIRHRLILDAIAEKENMRVSNKEIDVEAKRISSYAGDKREDVYNYYSEGIGKIDLRLELRRKKTLNFLINNAKIV